MSNLFSNATRMAGSAALAAWLLAAAPLAAAPALQVMAVTKGGQSNPGYLIDADAEGISIGTSPVGGNITRIAYTNIESLNVQEPQGWESAMMRFKAGNFEEAAQAFEQLGDDYEHLVPMRDGFGSLARLYQFKALRALGKLRDLDTAMTRQRARPLQLSEPYKLDLAELNGWALVGKADLTLLQGYINDYQDAAKTKWDLQPAFRKDLPPALVASLHFFRATLHEKQQNPELALIDYHSAITHNLGADTRAFQMAVESSLRIAAAKLSAKPDDAGLIKLAGSLAALYRDAIGGGKLPDEFAPLLVAPEPKTEEKAG
jgi:hypothetical protein